MTRTIALAMAALMATATLASAQSNFSIIERQGSSANIWIDLVRSDADGVVELYEGDRLVGTTSVHAGANADVKVNVGTPPSSDLTAVLKSEGGQVLATQRIDIDRNDS